jgi:hypothetical protein
MATDATALLKSIGANLTQVALISQYLFFRPLTSDPDAQGIIEMVKVIQTGINRANYFPRLSVDGKLGQQTAKALDVILPPANTYANTPWITILGAVAKAISNPPKKVQAASSSGPPMPGGGSLPLTPPGGASSLLKSPVVVGLGVFGLLVLVLGGKKKGGRRR